MKKSNVILLALFLSVMIVVSCQKLQQKPLSKDMARHISLLASETDVLGYANLIQIQNSSFFNSFFESADEHPFCNNECREFMEFTGLDFKKDIHEIYFSVKSTERKKIKDGLIVALGNFNSKLIMEYISENNKDNDWAKENYKNFELIRIDDYQKNRNKMFCFVEDKIFIAGNDEKIKFWLDNYLKPKNKLKTNPLLLKRVEQLKFKTSGWVIMDAETILGNINMHDIPEELEEIKNIKSFNCSFDASDNIKFYGNLECGDSEKAELFKDMIKGVISTAKLSISKDRAAIDVLNKIHIKKDKNFIEIDFTMSEADIKKLEAQKRSIKLPTI